MNETDYPALYQAANAQAASSQNWAMRALIVNFLCIVISSCFSTINLPSSSFAIAQTFTLLIGLGLTIYLAIGKPQQSWYGTRALAESIKTVSWRYMMRAEPYNISDPEADRHFLTTLKKLLASNRQLSSLAMPIPTADEITPIMLSIRTTPLVDRKSFYTVNRIDDQRKWYIKKSSFNKNQSRVWLGLIIFVYLLLIGFAVARPAYPKEEFWPSDILLTLASTFLAWTQTKRYQELAASYALTAHEISLLKAELPVSSDEGEFSSFVGDAENAFSREHTQWQARRDND